MDRARPDASLHVPGTAVPWPAPPPGSGLHGRRAECRELDGLVADVRAGKSRALVLSGARGAGKSALLGYLAGQASRAGCGVARAAGARSRAQLPFEGLRQLCAPALSRAGQLPAPQRDALRIASGLAQGPPPNRFYVGLAVLSLLSRAAGERPLVCVIDDEQWLDRDSAQALGVAARRLGEVPVALVFAAREPGGELDELPRLALPGLRGEDARALLPAALAGPADDRARDLVVAEARGNPLTLLGLPRRLSHADLAGGFGLPGALARPGPAQDAVTRQLAALPEQARRLVQLAAADPSGDRALVWRAAGRLGIPLRAAAPAQDAGLVEFSVPVRFRDPLARAAAYQSASPRERRQAHAALAEATSPQADPDRRAWHRAQAAAGPCEDVAAELERCAAQARARGGPAAAAAFLERSALLTPDPARHAARARAAAGARLRAAALGDAVELLAGPGAGPPDGLAGARAELLRGQLLLAAGPGGGALPLLLKAASRLEAGGADAATEAYFSGWAAALLAGCLADSALAGASDAAPALPPPGRPPVISLVLDCLAVTVTGGPPAAAGALRRAVSAFAGAGPAAQEALRGAWLAQAAAAALCGSGAWGALPARRARLAPDAGGQLPAVLDALGTAAAASGDFPAAAALAAEARAREVTGGRAAPFTVLTMAALRGRPDDAALVGSAVAEGAASGQATALACAHWAAAALFNGLGRHEEALAAARRASEDPAALPFSLWALPELVEAAARTGHAGPARDALRQLAEVTGPCGGDSALGIEARCRALLSPGDAAGDLFLEAAGRLSRAGLRPDLARARLLHGEWLRRQGRCADARGQLSAARDELAALGMDAFAGRARRELDALGDAAPGGGTVTVLTEQEALIAGLARDGRTNPEIGAQLFLSARTVQYHLGKVFAKLGIRSRRELLAVLA